MDDNDEYDFLPSPPREVVVDDSDSDSLVRRRMLTFALSPD